MSPVDPTAFVPEFDLPEPFSVRLGDAGDVDELVDVESLSQGAPWNHRVFEKEFGLDFSRTWVVDWDAPDAPAGIAAYLVFWVVHDEIHVLNVVTHPQARRRGLGRALMEELVEVSERNRVAIISLEVRVGNAAARGLYQSMGFLPIGARANYYADNYEDAEVMALILTG